MTEASLVQLQAFNSASSREVETGLLGWISIQVGGLWLLHGITLRRTRSGCLTLSFPERRDANGRKHPIVRPLDNDARKSIEAAVFAALKSEGMTP